MTEQLLPFDAPSKPVRRPFVTDTLTMRMADWWRSHPFAALQIGEDNDFVRRAWNAGQLETEDAGDLMHATIHPGNTSPRTMNDNWRPL